MKRTRTIARRKKYILFFSIVVSLLLVSAIIASLQKKEHSPGISSAQQAGSDPIIVAAGDMVCAREGSGDKCKQKEVSDLIIQLNPQAFLALGDLQYEKGAFSDFTTYYEPTYGRIKALTKPAPGNHEYNTSDAQGYYDYFNGIDVANGAAGERTKGYYSFDIGTWHIIALNSNCDALPGGCAVGSEQEQWLRADLAAHKNMCTLAYWHHPLFTSGKRGGNEFVKPLFQALYDYDADLNLVGHTHLYERFEPQDPDGNIDPIRGIVQMTVGTGGKETLHLGNSAVKNMIIRDTNSFGVIKLTLHPESYDWEFVSIPENSFSDKGMGQCHGDAGDIAPSSAPVTVEPTYACLGSCPTRAPITLAPTASGQLTISPTDPTQITVTPTNTQPSQEGKNIFLGLLELLIKFLELFLRFL